MHLFPAPIVGAIEKVEFKPDTNDILVTFDAKANLFMSLSVDEARRMEAGLGNAIAEAGMKRRAA